MTGDWSKIAVIDSENCSADLYAHLGHYISYLIYNKEHWKIQTIKVIILKIKTSLRKYFMRMREIICMDIYLYIYIHKYTRKYII